jgi:hypothetical protein
MATISATYPDAYKPDLVAAVRAVLGDDADGLTDSEANKKALKRYIKGLVASSRRRNAAAVSAAVQAADTAAADKVTATLAAIQARKDAEVAEDAAVVAAFGTDS